MNIKTIVEIVYYVTSIIANVVALLKRKHNNASYVSCVLITPIKKILLD